MDDNNLVFVSPSDSLEKSNCRRLTDMAIKAGMLVRPDVCASCGSNSDVVGMIQCHHIDYSKPLEVEWYCRECHEKAEILVANRQIDDCDGEIDRGSRLVGSIVTTGIYTRISPNPTKSDTENQERQLRDYANRRGWVVASVYSDIHVSGGKKGSERPQFKRMMDDARKHKFDVLLFWALDRFSREGIYETMHYLRQLKSWGVGYKSYTEDSIDSTGMYGELILVLMALMAKQERLRLVDRINAGLTTAKLRGTKLGRPRLNISLLTILDLRKSGLSIRDIAKRLKISVASAGRLVKKVDAPLEQLNGLKPVVLD